MTVVFAALGAATYFANIPGKMKVKTGGGAAGHNGIRSLIAHIGEDFHRIRIGVGHPGHKDLVKGFVLSNFSQADIDWRDPLLEAMAKAAGRFVRFGREGYRKGIFPGFRPMSL